MKENGLVNVLDGLLAILGGESIMAMQCDVV